MDMLTQEELAHLLRISWIVLIPVGVLLSMVLYQLVMLLHGLLDLLGLARYELMPALKDLRLTAEHVEALSRKAIEGVKTVEDSVSATGPALKSVGRNLATGVGSLLSGLKQSFYRN